MFKKFDKDDLIKISSNEHLSNDIRKIADIELYKRMKRERKRIKKRGDGKWRLKNIYKIKSI